MWLQIWWCVFVQLIHARNCLLLCNLPFPLTRYTAGKDYTVTDASLDSLGNWSKLAPFVVKRVAGGKIKPGSTVNISYNFLPGVANQMVGGRDVSCYVEPLYYSLMERAVQWLVDTFNPPWVTCLLPFARRAFTPRSIA